MVVRGEPPLEGESVLAAGRIVTQLWSRMCPAQVRHELHVTCCCCVVLLCAWTLFPHTHACKTHGWLCLLLLHQVEAHPVLQCTLRWLLSITARLVKAVDHNVISQVSLSLHRLLHDSVVDRDI